MRRWVLVPCVINKNIPAEIIKTFGDDMITKIKRLSESLITNYANERQVRLTYAEIENNVKEFISEYDEEDEVYLLLGGGILQCVFAKSVLDKHGIKYKMLVFEKKIGRYAVIDYDEGNGEITVS